MRKNQTALLFVLVVALIVVFSGCPVEVPTYSVIYDGNDCTSGCIEDTTVYYAGDIVRVLGPLGPDSLEKEGYRFLGWKDMTTGQRTITKLDEEDGRLLFNEGSTFRMPARDVTLTAVWEEILDEYLITYVGVDAADNSSNPECYTVEDDDIDLQAPSRLGYLFLGWYEDDTYTQQVTTIDTAAEEDITLYGKWESVEFPVLLMDGDEFKKIRTVIFGQTYGVEEYSIEIGPEPVGKDFDGWWTTLSNGTGVEVDNSTIVSTDNVNDTGNHALYARWILEQYDLTYHLDGGTNAAGNPATYTIEDTVTLEDAQKTGYDFDGWFDAATAGNQVTQIGPGGHDPIDLFAYWSAGTFSVSFEANGGSGTMNDQAIVFGTSENLEPNQYTFLGHDFIGWAESADGSVLYNDSESFTMDSEGAMLYAIWQAGTYSVQYHANGGSGSMSDQDIEFGSQDTLSANSFTKTGHSFAGWSTTAAGSVEYADQADYSMDSEGVNLYAVWTPDTYTVTYDGNGETSGTAPADQMKTYGVDLTLRTNTGNLERAGYTFDGWNSAANGSGTSYPSGGNYTTEADHTLYAAWTADTDTAYTVEHYTMNTDGSTYTLEDTDNLAGTTDTTATAVAKSYTGFTQNVNHADRVASGNIEGDESLVLKLYYDRNTYTVSFDSDGGEPVSDITDALYDATIDATAAPDYTDDTKYFAGWYTDSALTSKWDFASDTVTSNMTLYARWLDTHEVGDATSDGYIAAVNASYDYTDDTSWKYMEIEDTDRYETWLEASDVTNFPMGGWRLPTIAELTLVYENLYDITSPIGDFDDEPYWSSEISLTASRTLPPSPPVEYAKIFDFGDGTEDIFSTTLGLLRYRYVRLLPLE